MTFHQGLSQWLKRKRWAMVFWFLLPCFLLVVVMGWQFSQQSRRYQELTDQIQQLIRKKEAEVKWLEQRVKGHSIPSQLYFRGSLQHLRTQLNRLVSGLPGVRLLKIAQQKPQLCQVTLRVLGNPPLLAGVLKRLPSYLTVTEIKGERGEGFVLTCLVLIRKS